VRTSGAGNEKLMTMLMLGIALGAGIILFGGPDEFARAVNGFVRDTVETGIALTRSR
jgi:hypothetical protein